MMMAMMKFVFALALAVLLAACSTDNVENETRPAEDLYSEARAKMEDGDLAEATQLFEEVERQHPYSKWATEAQLMSALSSYEDQRYDEAIIALDRFIELHPGNERIDYAYYLKALSYYDQISDVRRDQEMTEQALRALDALIQRFPDSEYARDAWFKRDLAEDHLAGKQMEIGRYYLKRGEINAAVNRFRNVVTDYQTTTHVPEALHRLVEAYLILGLKDEAVRVASVLGHNYPGSRWYKDSYELLDPELREDVVAERSWIDRTVESMFR